MKVDCHRSQVASHAPLGREESPMPWSQLVAAQHTEDGTRTGTAPAREQLRCNRQRLQSTSTEWTTSIRKQKEKQKETLWLQTAWLQKLRHSEALSLSGSGCSALSPPASWVCTSVRLTISCFYFPAPWRSISA